MWLAAPIGAGDKRKWGSSGSWGNRYEWYYALPADHGGYLVTDTSLLSIGPSGQGNYYIELEEGVYNVALWFSTDSPNKDGVREWRVVGTNSVGPATFGDNNRAQFHWVSGQSVATPVNGLHFLGERMLIQTTGPSDIRLQVRQTAGYELRDCSFFATITKVK
jgi:hypothetical protein